MPSLIDMRRRIRAVKSTQQITKAMKMVAASKLRRAQERIQQARPFATQMRRVLDSMASRVDPAAHPLLASGATRKAGGTTLLIVITADRGLCGSFNTNIIKAVGDVHREHRGRQVALGLVGRRGPRLLRRAAASRCASSRSTSSQKLKFADAEAIAQAGDRGVHRRRGRQRATSSTTSSSR